MSICLSKTVTLAWTQPPKPDGHQLENLSRDIPIALRNMEHVTLMNHPDIHWAELKLLLNNINFASVWKATINDVMSFANSRYDI